MTEQDQIRAEVDQFIRDQIDTVPHLEALLLVWNSRPKLWLVEEMAQALFLKNDATRDILEDLTRRRVIVVSLSKTDAYGYEPEPERDRLMSCVDLIYRRELIRVTRLIHSKASAAVREFARAFRLKKERD